MSLRAKGIIDGINGPVVEVVGSNEFKMLEMVTVGYEKLIGEVIGIKNDKTIVQVYEITTGIKCGEPVEGTDNPMSVTLGPGVIGNIFDGIERPLKFIQAKAGTYIDRGIDAPSLDVEKQWKVTVTAKLGDKVFGGEIIASTPETSIITNYIMIPNDIAGTITSILTDGDYTINQAIATVTSERGIETEIKLFQTWPIRTQRPYKNRLVIDRPLITGQRIIDTMLPIAKGGTAAVPGGFGTGKTMTQHQLAKWSDADIIVYIGCGERGNEMTQVLDDFSKLIDPKSNRPLMDRTVLIANTSNMPVAAREASIYTGVTIAEYYRDMGYHVAIMADSTSRWAEALREISGRLEEMPAEEGFPAYLSSRLSEFYERAGYFEAKCGKEGSVTIIGAVSPQGGDFSEPVTQNTKRFVRCFWALDKSLAYARHYPAINWLSSYSEYLDDLGFWYDKNIDPKFMGYRAQLMSILQEESSLMEIVKLIGADVLPDSQKLILDIAKVIRLGFLQQNAYHVSDTYVPLIKQFKMMDLILYLYEQSKRILDKDIVVSELENSGIFEEVIKIKYTVDNENMAAFDEYKSQIAKIVDDIIEKNKDIR